MAREFTFGKLEVLVIRINGEKRLMSPVVESLGEKGIIVKSKNKKTHIPIKDVQELFQSAYPTEPIRVSHISYRRDTSGKIIPHSGHVISHYD